MKEFLHQLLLPHHSNNYRSQLLHHTSLLLVIFAFMVGGILIHEGKTSFPQVLGESTNIPNQELFTFTNLRRQEQGIQPLKISDTLSQVAAAKAQDMFAKNYWAHNAPDGTTPWYFFKKSGYDYVYAGENLARGFTNAQSIVQAWMASQSHRDNLLSRNYTEVGFAVQQGILNGENTILVVQEFGSRNVSPNIQKKVPEVPQTKAAAAAIPTIVPVSQIAQVATQQVAQAQIKPLINTRTLSWNMSTIVLSIFIFVLLLDMIIIERKKIVRLVGHNIDHMFFLGGILLFVLLFAGGVIL